MKKIQNFIHNGKMNRNSLDFIQKIRIIINVGWIQSIVNCLFWRLNHESNV